MRPIKQRGANQTRSGVRQRSRELSMEPTEPLQGEGQLERRVATVSREIFIPAIAIQRHSYVFASQLCKVVRRKRARVGVRFFVLMYESRQYLNGPRLNDEFGMSRAELLCDTARKRQLVVLLMCKSYGKCSDRYLAVPRHHGDYGAGIDAAGKEGSDWDVWDHPEARRFVQRRQNKFTPFLLG